MKEKILNLIDIEIKDNKVVIEYMYKHKKNKKITAILNTSKCENFEVKSNTVDFSNELDITRIKIISNNVKPDIVKLIIKEENEEFTTKLLDNKNEKIISDGNSYCIFTGGLKINILEDKIAIENEKKFDKLIYEVRKQIYSIKKFKRISLLRLLARKNKKYYLFNDRIMYADDNAEQLFKHINKEHKKIAKNSYFVLDKKSSKIKEIKKYGKVLKYGSLKHKIKYLNCRMVISSHASYFDRVYNPFSDKEMYILKDLINKKFIFLQHGVTFNDVHKILNRPQIIADLFVTTTNKEYNEILSDKYMYDDEMVICTGLARFDKLKNNDNKVILIAPTWRTYLTNVKYGDKNKESFEESDFYKQYKFVLENKELLEKLRQNKYNIYFLLHPAFIQFRKEFEKHNTDVVKILTTENTSYSKLFRECSLFITDYSSTHFDVAFLKKPIVYYQFDKEKFYESHYDKGYFNYEKDGFGDVVYDKESLIEEIMKYVENKCKIEEKYKKRVEKTFKYLDNNNSERIYKEIVKLDSKNEINYRFNNVH